VVLSVLVAGQGVLSGCGQEAAGSPSASQTDGSSAGSPSLVSAVFRAFTRSDSTRDAQLPDTTQPSDITLNQFDIVSGALTFEQVFDVGDEIFATQFTSEHGVGANLANDAAVSVRFSRSPRADLPGFQADPFRATGPNAQSCASCHEVTFEDGAGGIEANAMRDPQRTADPAKFIQRNAPHVFGLGALQLLAEEATADLKGIRARAIAQAQVNGSSVRVPLTTRNNVNYGFITAAPSGTVDTTEVEGVDADLVVKPYQWKGAVAFARDFVRDASNNELGMQPVEMFGANVDADHDGVSNELSVGQITALTIYQVAQPRPVTIVEANQRDPAAFPLTRSQRDAIRAGDDVFSRIGCADCHIPALRVRNPVFSEPSTSPDYRDATLPSGVNPLDVGLDPARPVTFDLTLDSPDEIPFESDGRGGALVRLYGDLKRHDMGPGLAESIDEKGTGASVWRTRELWGVGSTGPWLHDGRATTLREAILLHGGEAQESRDRFAALRSSEQAQLTKFLQNLVLFKAEPAAVEQVVRQQDRDRRH
jgi:mono/diheme cytochrome c family protein